MKRTIAKVRGWHWTLALEWKVEDAWIGVFWAWSGTLLNVWICLVPCLPIHVQYLFRRRAAASVASPVAAPKEGAGTP